MVRLLLWFILGLELVFIVTSINISIGGLRVRAKIMIINICVSGGRFIVRIRVGVSVLVTVSSRA